MPTPPFTGTRAGWFVLPMALAGLVFSGISYAETPPARGDSKAPTDAELDEVIEHARQEDRKDPDGTEPDGSWFTPGPGGIPETTYAPQRDAQPPARDEARQSGEEEARELPDSAPTDEELDEVIEHTRQEDLKPPDADEPDESWFDSTPEHEAAEPQPDDRKPDARRTPAPPEG